MAPIISLLVPLAVELIKAYVKNSDSSKDNKVLEVVQTGCKYLAVKDNNTLTISDSDYVNMAEMEVKNA